MSSTLSASLQPLSQDFLGWAGSNGVRVLRKSSPIIPHCPARSLCCSQHVHTYINTRTRVHAYMRSRQWALLGKAEFLCRLAVEMLIFLLSLSMSLSLSPALSLSLSTFAWTRESWILRSIRIRWGLNSACLHCDMFTLVLGWTCYFRQWEWCALLTAATCFPLSTHLYKLTNYKNTLS